MDVADVLAVLMAERKPATMLGEHAYSDNLEVRGWVLRMRATSARYSGGPVDPTSNG
jgi:hypothetical protein